jgi:nucleotide-binding universal stress UspA family protein
MSEQPAMGSGHIVVGVDGSESSRQAVIWAVRYGEMVGGDVDAVISWHHPTNSGLDYLPVEWNPEQDARSILAGAVTEVLGNDVPPSLRQLVREGNPAKVLLDEAKDAQLLVVGSRGHGGFAGLLLGSVSANCAEHAQCPVLVIHGKAL